MKQEFKQMPEPLQKQVFIRIGLGALSAVLFAAALIYTRDIFLTLPFAGIAVFFAAAAFALFRRVVLGEYVAVSGKCAEIGLTALKRRAKYIIMDTDVCKLKVILRSRMRKIPAGTEVKLYIAKNTPVYEQNGSQALYSYLAIEAIK